MAVRPSGTPFCAHVARIVEKHGDFQMIYYGHHVGGNAHKRDAYKGHAYFDDCAAFCERWDQSSFDPEYDSLPVSFFAPMVHEVFARTPYDPKVIRAGEQVALTDEALAAARV